MNFPRKSNHNKYLSIASTCKQSQKVLKETKLSNQKLVLNLEVDLCAHICSYLRELLQILPAEEYTTCKRNGCVKLRQEESGLGSEEPISVPTLLQDAAAAYPDVRTHLLLYYSKYSILTLYNKSSKGKGSSFWYRTSLLKSTHKLFFSRSILFVLEL